MHPLIRPYPRDGMDARNGPGVLLPEGTRSPGPAGVHDAG